MDDYLAYTWILYLDPLVHTEEYKLVKNAGIENLILLQDIKKANVALPSWTNVLPVLLHTASRKAYRGHSCLKKMISIELPAEHLKRLSKRRIKIFDDE